MSNETLRFEEAMSKLEDIVQKLESGEVPLEDAITLYKEGMELSAYCHGKLQDAEEQLITIIDKEGKPAPFNPAKGQEPNE
ncbi:exodeoxyribonuclease VII small subunit [Sporosarcina highlanderae]|uniref:Exodeoxyribonuclease 7 small subunit n=1 Tax=Sporosarcina highlanderae TaxID=3035916 RepID=A0ABT8JRM0_9BACL|nr:exodeoxyribonuclease VII small subunit [Sporosarcina highlanderae]MDN4607778.1 exodeoxyribonuclease VII small subunit [Sporosarcina highlanderae]